MKLRFLCLIGLFIFLALGSRTASRIIKRATGSNVIFDSPLLGFILTYTFAFIQLFELLSKNINNYISNVISFIIIAIGLFSASGLITNKTIHIYNVSEDNIKNIVLDILDKHSLPIENIYDNRIKIKNMESEITLKKTMLTSKKHLLTISKYNNFYDYNRFFDDLAYRLENHKSL